MSEQIDSMKSALLALAQGQMSNLECVDAKELGEVVDMIKDLEEAKYYCAITKAMEDRDKERESSEKIETAVMMERMRSGAESSQSYYGGSRVRYPGRDWDDDGRMYYDGRDDRRGTTPERSYTTPSRDYREGRSPISRKGYIEAKNMHMDDKYQREELTRHLTDIGEDLAELASDASPEMKQIMHNKLMAIAQTLL